MKSALADFIHGNAMRRKAQNRIIVALATFIIALSAQEGRAFDFCDVENRARSLALHPYRPVERQLPDSFPKMDYSAYRRIQYDHRKAIWAGTSLPFRLETFHRGFLFPERIRIYVLEGDRPVLLPYSPDLFVVQPDPEKPLSLPPLPPDFGFSGVRVHHPVDGDWTQEVAVFQGASYFRMKGKSMDYGLSARGLAIDTTTGSEEFPVFEEIWIRRPGEKDKRITVLALLNGPACAGAYEFDIEPGQTTLAAVRAKVFFRHQVQKVGLAPVTSMFWYGENTFRRPPEYRPEVHDSDGLLMASSDGTRLWRPLQTLTQHLVNHYRLESPRGFGLLQRDRSFNSYRDLEAKYYLRPSLWVEPQGDWGKGEVVLWQIPTTTEGDDNIVAFWSPENPPKGGDVLDFSYSLYWTSSEPPGVQGGRVYSTHLLPLYGHNDLYRFLIDFTPPTADKILTEHSASPRHIIRIGSNGTLLENYVKPNPEEQTWRLVFAVRLADPRKPTDLQCYLEDDRGYRSETWLYTLVPQ
jgi:glucans biosynthesis protein